MGVVWGMFGESGYLLALMVCFFVSFFSSHFMSSKALQSKIDEFRTEFLDSPSSQTIVVDEIKEELLDLVEEVIGNMQPPNAGDHFVGMLAQIGQMWAMRKFNIDPTSGKPMLEQVIEGNTPDFE